MRNYQIFHLNANRWTKTYTVTSERKLDDILKSEILLLVETISPISFHNNIHQRLPEFNDPWFQNNNIKITDICDIKSIKDVQVIETDGFCYTDTKSGARRIPRSIYFKDLVVGRRFGRVFCVD